MHTHIYSWKLGPGFVLLTKVCPWKKFYNICHQEEDVDVIALQPDADGVIRFSEIIVFFVMVLVTDTQHDNV